MSIERTFGPWEEMQRHCQNLAYRLAHGFSDLLHCPIIPPSFTWPLSHPKTTNPFDTDAILDIGNCLSRAGVDFVACLNGVVQQFFRRLPMPFRLEDGRDGADKLMNEAVLVRRGGEGSKIVAEEIGEWRSLQKSEVNGGMQRFDDEGTDLTVLRQFGRSQGSINLTTNYNSRTNGIESFLVARGDLWRAEVSHGLSTSGNENPPLFLIQLGPVLFFRDTTLLLPVHISKQHLLWYGYDRKSFMDLQFPNGQLTYIAGEGLTHSAYLTAFGGLLQAQGQYPGETRFSFSCKNKHGTRITPMLQLPDKSFAVGLAETLAWRRSGLMVRPSIQLSICPTFGGSNPGLRAELIQTLKEKLNLICGFSCAAHSSAFASLAIGRSKWNGHIGSSGIVFRLEAPLNGVGRPSFAVQFNSGAEF
ncbi:hypothetical protein M5K25_003426 [Dendrobium thyrsiflorum]|uniref:Uncharacterized protein n=1 Tax=Dendrobium thyrsiflorum TaxID=117978 RepID=A0ABD0VRF4_DENTH